MTTLNSSFNQRGYAYLTSTFYILNSLPQALAQATRLHVFLLMNTAHFYQLADIISFESWDKYIREEDELEDTYGITSIWITIRTFESIIQEIIDDATTDHVQTDQETD